LPKLTRKKLVEREAKKLGIQVRKSEACQLAWCKFIRFINVISRVADPHYFNADLDPSFRFNVDSELTYGDPVPGSCFLSKGCKFATTGIQTLQGSILSLLRLNCERQQLSIAPFELKELLNFDFNNTDPDPASKNNADQDPQPLV
jgi:hypothetical protein